MKVQNRLARQSSVALGFFACLFSPHAYADYGVEVPNQESVSLTLSVKQAVEHALARNPTVMNDKEYLNEADENKNLAISLLFPTINGVASAYIQKDAVNTNTSGNVPYNGSPFNNYLAQLQFTQPLYRGGALLAGLSYAKKDKEIHQYTLDIEERNLSVQVIQAFYNVFTNKQAWEKLLENEKVEKESLVTTERYYRIGRAQLLDVLQIKSQIALLEPQITTAENQMRSSISQLVSLMHEGKATTVNLVGSLAAVDLSTVKALVPARQKLPEISQGELTISQFVDKSDVTMSTYNPSMNLQGTFGQTSTTNSDLFSGLATGWTIGVYLTIPLFTGLGSIDQRKSLDSQTAQLEYGQAQLLDSLALTQVQAEQTLDTAAKVLEGSKEAAVLSRASLKEAQREFKIQTINLLQLLTSETADLTAQVAYVQSKGSYLGALATFCQATGIPIEKLVDILDSVKSTRDDNVL